MENFVLTPDILASIAGAIISLGFSYIPGLSVKFAALLPEVKRLIMAGIMVAVSIAIFALGCNGVLVSGIACEQAGLVQLVTIVLSAIIANQATYSITPQTNAVKSAK